MRLLGSVALVTLWSLSAGCSNPDLVDTTVGSGGQGGETPTAAGGAGGRSCSETELCNGVDDDCDGDVDEGCDCVTGDTQPCYSGPPELLGVGACQEGEQICDEQGTWGACEDGEGPSEEQCNGEDDDCDGQTDEDLGTVTCGLGICQVTVEACEDGEPVPCYPTEPAESESCDGFDDDCDGEVDEGCSCIDGNKQPCYTGSTETQNVGECSDGEQICSGGQWGACTGDTTPAQEVCDGKDNDCDTQTDEDDPEGGGGCTTTEPGICSAGVEHCVMGKIECQSINSPTTESCNGVDDDCDGFVDEDNPDGGADCLTNLEGVCEAGTMTCVDGMLECVQNEQPSTETCDGEDDDCDGVVDDGNPGGGGSCSTGKDGICDAGTVTCVNGTHQCVQNEQPSTETCDGEDDDCDGSIDEGNPDGGASCSTGKDGICDAGTMTCVNGSLQCVQDNQPTSEVCGNNEDEDCDGTLDNGCGCNTNEQDCDGDSSNGCECTGTGCCNTSCQTQHDNGQGQFFYDCVALGTHNLTQAQKACAAYTGDAAKCSDFGEVCNTDGDNTTDTSIVCASGASDCACWSYSGSAPGYTYDDPNDTGCYCPLPGDPTWN